MARERTPVRTCLGCRKSHPQAALLRIVRTPDGSVEPDPGRRRGGRGAYLCPSESCLSEAVRRARWAHAFRAPTALSPEALAPVRAWIAQRETGASSPPLRDGGLHETLPRGDRPGTYVEGGW